MTNRSDMTVQGRDGSGVRRVLRIVIGVLAIALMIAGTLLPFLSVPLGDGRHAPVSAYDVVVQPAVLQDGGPQAGLILAGFIGLLVVLALLSIVVILVVLADRIRPVLRGIGLALGVLGVLGALAVIVLTGIGMRNVSAMPGAGGALLLVGAIAAAALIGGAGRRRR